MKPVFVDTSVVLLAVGTAHPLRAACRELIRAAAQGKLRLHLSVESGQEFLFHRLRRTARDRALAEFDELDTLAVWHPFDADTLRAARELMGSTNVRGRDAVLAATALAWGFTTIVSSDPDFDAIPGLKRLPPEELPELLDIP